MDERVTKLLTNLERILFELDDLGHQVICAVADDYFDQIHIIRSRNSGACYALVCFLERDVYRALYNGEGIDEEEGIEDDEPCADPSVN